MINAIASISVKAPERGAFIEIFKANVPKVLEPGFQSLLRSILLAR
jgi:hypothetical protein